MSLCCIHFALFPIKRPGCKVISITRVLRRGKFTAIATENPFITINDFFLYYLYINVKNVIIISIHIFISLIGLEPLIESSCMPDIRVLLYNNTLSLDSYLNPFALLFAYFAMALTTKHLIKPRVSVDLVKSIDFSRFLFNLVYCN